MNQEVEEQALEQPQQEPPGEQQDEQKVLSFRKLFFALSVSVAILYYFFNGQDWEKILSSMEGANIGLAIAATFVLALNNWVFEVLIRGTHFKWFHEGLNGTFPWKDYFWMRGALYLILVVNGPLSGAARVLYLVNKTKISWVLYFGIGFFRLVLRAGLIAFVMLGISYWLLKAAMFEQYGIPEFYWFAFIAWNLFVVVDFYLAFQKGYFLGISKLIEFKTEHLFFHPFREASLYQWVWTLGVGTIPIVIYLIAYWLMATAFDIYIPFWFFCITIPFVLIVSNLPIAFGGFGTTTMAWVLFYSNYADEAAILSFSIFLPIARMIVHALIGLICLKAALSDLMLLLDEAKKGDSQREKAKEDIKSIFLKLK